MALESRLKNTHLSNARQMSTKVIDIESVKVNIITRDALKGHTVSKNGSISFLRGMP